MSRSLAAALLAVALVPAVLAQSGAAALSPLPDKEWDREKAAHLLRRAGFGGTPAEVENLAALGLSGAVDALVDYDKVTYTPAPPPIDPVLNEPLERGELRNLSDEARQQRIEARRRAERRTFEETRLWWIERMLASPRPLEEKMTLFWHGHFTSGMREVRNPIFMKEQNEFLRRHALDSFKELLIGISRDRAMLAYLDGNRNVKSKPNENYGRELLELFTLGVGNYTEADIKAAARAFTGWSYTDEGFVLRRREHDFDVKTFLGRTGKWDGEDVIEIILEQPACSRFLARNLLEFFCQPEPERTLVEALAAEIRRNKYQLRPTMKTLFKSRAFYHASARGSLVKSPVELVVGTARTLGVKVTNLFGAERAMAGMGQELMQPPNVKGWDGGAAWINTATLFNRYNVVGGIIHGEPGQRPPPRAANDEAKAAPEGGPMMKAAAAAQSRLTAEKPAAFDALAAVRSAHLLTGEEVVDYFAGNLLAVPLPAAKREQLVKYLAGDKPDAVAFDASAKDAPQRLRTLVHLICSTPEYQMN